MGAFENRRWVIIPITSIGEINFDDILELSPDSLRKSVDESQTFVKYDGVQPSSVASLTGVSSEYNHSEIIIELDLPKWINPNPTILED